MAKKLIIGNWKMHPATLKEAEKLFSSVAKGLPTLRKTEVVVCPPFVYLSQLKKISRKLNLGAQDAFYGETGAFTGEVSPEMLYGLGVRYLILGHSERRALGEDNELINKKIKSSLSLGLRPILCVGEDHRDESHEYFNLVKTQVEECLRGVSKDSFSKVIIAYEPVWALSSTKDRRDATSFDSNEMAIFIRKVIADMFGPAAASNIRIIYGGSVNEKNVEEFLRDGGVDGVLPGKASLTPTKFIKMIEIAETI